MPWTGFEVTTQVGIEAQKKMKICSFEPDELGFENG
jgi:hypothetical protein